MISLIKDTFYEEEKTLKALREFLKKGQKLSMGDNCKEFEKKLSEWQGRKECVLVNSGSSANLALLQSLLNLGRLKKGDRVGFSALTWATNVMPIIQLGLIPVPVDVEIKTLNISRDKLYGLDIDCLFITNLLGLCSDISKIAKLCEAHKIIVIEDNCESMGSVYGGTKLGNFGLASTFSFYVGHHLSTIEGGSVMTDDEELSYMLRMVRAHGWKRDTDEDLDFYGRYTFYDLGYNLRPTEITGVCGLVGMTDIDSIIVNRAMNAEYLKTNKLYDNSRVYPLISEHMDVYSAFSTPVVYVDVKDKEIVLEKCKEAGIESRPIVGGNITEQPFFKKYIGHKSCPNAEIIHRNGIYVANNPQLTKEELDTILGALCLK
jgi:CDP-6-deoxy-D-xylo-4-hexulose-3-dehydrase